METGIELKEVKKVFNAKEVIPPERWDALIEECREIITEHIVESREAIIKMKWELGDRLLEEGEEAVTKALQRVGVELRISESQLWYCLAFRKKFPRLEEVWEKAPEGKNISWHKLIHNYIDFTTPKPEIPIEEIQDKWGIVKWWDMQPDLHTLRIQDKEMGFTLIVKRDKQVTVVHDKMNLRDIYKELGDYYILLKKWSHDDLNRNDYNRMNKALKELFEKAKYNKDKVKAAIKWCHDQYIGSIVDWTLETVVKKFAEASRPVKPYEKYLTKRDK